VHGLSEADREPGAPLRRGRPEGRLHRPSATLARHAESLDSRGLRSLILELALSRRAYFARSSTYSEDLTAAVTAYAIDIASIARDTTQELEIKRAERSPRKGAGVRAE
jgi:hypothetical protein